MHQIAMLLLAAAASSSLAGRLQGGEWEIGATVTRVELSGGTAEQTRQLGASRPPARFCLPDALAARGIQELLKPAGACVVTASSIADGHVTATMSCPAGATSAATISLSGTVSPESFAIENHSVLAGGASQPSGTVDQVATGRRIGPCNP